MFVVRVSNHIKEDLKRNWSSYNYGLDGFNCTEEEMNAAIDKVIETDDLLVISILEMGADDLISKRKDIRELYQNYWVLADTRGGIGLSCVILDAETEEEALTIINDPDFTIVMEQDGDTVDCRDAEIVKTFNVDKYEWPAHLLKIED